VRISKGVFIITLILSMGIISFKIAVADNFKDFTYDSKGRRDPFVPLINAKAKHDSEKEKADTGAFQMEGIIYDPGGSLAIINGKVLREGDVLNGYKVAQIQKSCVNMSREGETFTLNLKKSKRGGKKNGP